MYTALSVTDLIEEEFSKGSAVHAKLKKLSENYLAEMSELAKPNKTLSCITHGDCWPNNILFKYGEVRDSLLQMFSSE